MEVRGETTDTQAMIPLTEKQEAAGLKSIGYSKKQLVQDVKILRDWLAKQSHLPPSRQKESDYFFIRFLTGCKGSLEKSKLKIDAYYTAKSTCQNIFNNYDPGHESIEEALKFAQCMILPKAAPDSTRVYFARIVGPFSGTYPDVFKSMFQLFDLVLRVPEMSSSNFISVTDLGGATIDMVTRLSPSLVQQVFHLIQEVYPFRTWKLVYVNASPAVEAATNYLVKPFLSEKIKRRFIVTSSGPEIVKKWVPLDILPKEWGGSSEESLDTIHEKWRKLALTKRNQFSNEWSELVDETKRPKGMKSNNPYFGLDGSIKTLCLD